MRPHRSHLLVLGLAASTIVSCSDQQVVQPDPPDPAPSVQAPRGPRGVIPGQYIIQLRDDVPEPVQVATQLALTHRLTLRHTYQHTIKGFSAVVPEGRLEALRRHPMVLSVQPNHYVTIHAQPATNVSLLRGVAPPPLSAPSGLAATASSATAVHLTWVDNSGGETGTKIERRVGTTGGFTEVADVGADVTVYDDSNLSAGVSYCYRTRAYRTKKQSTDYSSYSSEACATTPAPPPAAPSNATSAPMAADQIDVGWTDNAGDETGFSLERRLGQTGTFNEVGQTGANTTNVANTGLDASTEYCHRVRAFNDGGFSSYSNTTCATTSATPPPLSAPSATTATASSVQWVTVVWTDNSTDELGFRVERRLGQTGTFTQIAQMPSNATGMLDQAIAPETEYCYRVYAYNAQGVSDYSNISCVTTLAGGPTAPAAPSDLATSAVDEETISLDWTDNAGNESGFKVERRDPGGVYVEIAQLGRNSQSFTSGSLQASTEYCYRVRGYIAGGSHSAYSNESCATTVGPTIPVAAPTGLTASANGEQQVDLAWTDNAGDEDGFEIERRLGQTGSFGLVATIGPDVTAHSDPGLTAGTEYCYRVRAFRGADRSSYSTTECATTDAPPPPPPPSPPAAPSAVGASAAAPDRIDVNWTDNADNETGFSVERRLGQTGSFSEVAQPGANGTSYANTGLDASTEYCYQVRAFNDGGFSSYSNVACATTPEPPPPPTGLAPPTGLNASAPNAQWVRVRWSDNSADETGFRVERRLGQTGAFTQIAQMPANAKGMLDQAIATETEYCYRAYAFNAQGVSDYSNVDCVTTKAGGSIAPAAPSNLAASTVDHSTVALAWTDNAGNESGFIVEQAEGPGGTWNPIAQLGPNSSSYTSEGLLASTEYCYRVRTFIIGGSHSAYSNESCATTADPPAPPAAPTALAAVTVDHQRIDMSWTDNAVNEDGFRVERREGQTGSFAQVGAVGADVTSHVDAGLSGETEYCYRVVAFNAQGDGVSNTSCATTGTPPPPPPPPPPGQCTDAGNHDTDSGQHDLWNIEQVKAHLNATWQATQVSGCEIIVHFFGLDTGVDGDHPDLNVLELRNFVASEPGRNGEDANGHGTHTAGTAAGIDGNGGVVGVAPGAPIHGFRVCDDSGVCADDDILAAVDAVTGWKNANQSVPAVANMSLGGTLAAAVDTAIRRSVNAGVVYAVSAGNGLIGACLIPGLADSQSPAKLGDDDITASNGSNGDTQRVNGVITTTSSDRNDQDTNCNYGNPVTVAAPGLGVTSTWLEGGFNTTSGTSMASPHAAGAAILYLQVHPSATPAQVEAAIVSALEAWVTDDLPNADGRLNVQPLQ
jgi:titin